MSRRILALMSFILVLGLVSNASAELVGQWKLDDGGGTTAMDATGNGNDGTLEDDPIVVNGQFGQALAFDNSRVAIGASDTLTADLFQGSFTLTTWINPTRTGNTWQQIFRAMREAGNSNDTLFINNDGRLSWRGLVGGSWAGGMCETAADVAPAGQWTHVAVTGDGTNFRVYINGALSQESAFQTTDGANATYYIGGDPGTAGESYAGMVDDLRVYDHVLSEDDIRGSMENQGGAIVKAYGADPSDGAMLEATWVTLTWRAGDLAVSQDVYMGDNFDDVDNGSADTFQGNQASTMLIVGFPGFPFPEGLVPGTTYYWRADGVNPDEPNSPWKGDIWSFWIPPRTAWQPVPVDGVSYVDTDVELSWTPGFGSQLHTVYFGESLDDVSNATGGAAQSATTFTPGPLTKDTVYYWRVDEFQAPVTHKGDIWSFTTLPDVPITDPDLMGWWKLDEGMGGTAVDWSGQSRHGTLVGDAQWVPGFDGGALEFDGASYVDTDYTENLATWTIACWVKSPAAPSGASPSGPLHREQNYQFNWNHGNDVFRGAAAMNVGGTWHAASYMPLSANTWYHLAATYDGNVFNAYRDGVLTTSNPAPSGAANSESNSVKLGRHAAAAQFFTGTVDDARVYNRALTVEEIQEVMKGDTSVARHPNPATGSTPNIGQAATLTWSAGDSAAQHDVYFGTDEAAVAGADTSDTTGVYRGRQPGASYSAAADIEWGGGPYYWRIDEFNTDSTIGTGWVWSFSVADYLTVDDFESYNDIDPPDAASNRIFDKWIDGFGTTTNGALVGNDLPPYAETTIVHSGAQAMIYAYDNNLKTSEATLTLSQRDWTAEGVTKLSLWIRGGGANAADRVFVAAGGTAVVYHDDTSATQLSGWNEWVIDLSAFGGFGADLTNVDSITIGVGTKNAPAAGGTGTMYFDDIRLIR